MSINFSNDDLTVLIQLKVHRNFTGTEFQHTVTEPSYTFQLHTSGYVRILLMFHTQMHSKIEIHIEITKKCRSERIEIAARSKWISLPVNS